MGVAVLEGEELIYYTVKTFRKKRPAAQLVRATRETLEGLIRAYRPTMLAYEEGVYLQQASSELLAAEEREIRRTAKALGLPGRSYTPADVRQMLCGNAWATKQIVAAELVRRFPELAGYRRDQSPRSERYWLNMFDALAVAVVAINDLDGRSASDAGATVAQAA